MLNELIELPHIVNCTFNDQEENGTEGCDSDKGQLAEDAVWPQLAELIGTLDFRVLSITVGQAEEHHLAIEKGPSECYSDTSGEVDR